MAKFLPPSKNTKMYAGGTSGFNELTGQPAQTGGMFTEDPFATPGSDPFATPGFGTNPFEQPEFGEIVDNFAMQSQEEFDNFIKETLRNEEYQRFIAQNFFDLSGLDEGAELPEFNDMQEDTFQMILDSILGRAEDIPPEIREDPERVQQYLNEQLGIIGRQIADAGGYEQWLANQGEGEEVVDPNQDTLPGDTTGGDTTTGGGEEGGEQEGGEEEQEGWLERLGNWWDSVVSSVGSGASGSTPPMLPGSSGVIISPGSAGMSWPDIIANPGAWQVYLPGVIPGLPQSPTIIGTIEDILSSPGEVLGDLWDQIQNTVENPGEFLEDLLNGVVDDDGLITIGGISTVVGTIYDDLFGDDDTTTTPGGVDDTQTTVPGGAEEEEEEEDEGPVKGDPVRQAPLQPDPVEEDLPLSGDGPVKGDPVRQAPISDEPQPELGGAGGAVSAGGGGGGMMRRGSPHKGSLPYNLPQGEMLLYRPPTANEILIDFTNGLALQRKRGMLV